MKGFQKLTLTEEALREWFCQLNMAETSSEDIHLGKALNRILAKDIVSGMNLPRFDRSAVDGYAIKAEETLGASQFKPIVFELIDSNKVEKGQARPLWTGNPIPEGADASVMIENTQKRGIKIEVTVQLAPGDNVSKKGEDIKKGEIVAKRGIRLNPYHLGLFSALGRSRTEVAKKPRIAILATGNELARVGESLGSNLVFESNAEMLSAMCTELGAEPIDLGVAKDDLEEIVESIETGLNTADAVVTTGGTSVGGLDLVPEAVNRIGKPGVIVHGMAMRPGMPTALAVLRGKPIIVLSGNPVAAVVGFEVFARPLICKMLGMTEEEQRTIVKAKITRRVSTALGRKNFVRVRVFLRNTDWFAEPVSARGSGAISTMTKANGFLVVPEDREGVSEGETVIVRLFGSVMEEKEGV